MRYWVLLLLGGCAWNFGADETGKMQWKQQYPTGTSVYYEDGTYQKDHKYNSLRPKLHSMDE